jgi:hypothetical protein
MGDTDTTVVVTHNWRLSTAKLAKLFPLVSIYWTLPGTAAAIVSVALTNSLAVTITKVSATGSGGTFTVILQRPHSIVS